jgi:hypothetical protein
MTLNPKPDITVNMCYELEKETVCITLNKDEANSLRHEIEDKKGTVWWFTPIA